MGCTQSANGQTTLLLASFNPELKKKLISAIQDDDVATLAELQAKEDFPTNVELSDNGELWTGIHFCCRFDSPCCLDFLLKKAYLQNVKQFIHFVNQQTVEGLTCLHLCAMWASFKCFALLLRYGALNLSLLDAKHRTAEMIMKGNGLTEMQEITAKLKGREGNITEWNHTLLHQILDVSKLRSTEFHKQQIAQILSKEMGNKTAASLPQPEKQAKLWQEKGRLQKESDEIYSQIKAKLQKLPKTKESTLGDPIQNTNPLPSQDNIPKNEEILNLQKRLIGKEQQIQKLKQQLRGEKSSRIDEVLQLQNNKIDLENQQTKEALSQFATQFSSFKKQLITNKAKYVPTPKVLVPIKEYRKGKQAKGAQSNAPSVQASASSQFETDPSFNALPQNVKQKYRIAKQKGSFVDEQFPHNESSFGAKYYPEKYKSFPQIVWLRPTQFLSSNFVLFDNIEPNDIKQGRLGVCYLLATVSQLARQPQRIKNLFVFYDTQIGFYVVRLYTNGKPNYMVLDDYFPCREADKTTLFSRAVGYEIWVLLLQKAWAKQIGNYFSAQAMNTLLLLDDFTGSPVLGHYFKDKPNDKTGDINAYSAKKKHIVLSTNSNKMQGIVNGHAYSLLKVIENNGTYLYKLRNPWGRFEWDGSYGEHSTLWTPQLRLKCEQIHGDDGIFFMTQRQLLEAFQYYAIELGQANANYSYIEFKSEPEQALYFRFKLTKKGMMGVKITQFFDRMLRNIDGEYKYSPVIFQLGKIGNNSVTFLSQGASSCNYGAKTVYICDQLYAQYEAGDYFVRVVMQWVNPNKYNTGVLSVYGEEATIIGRLQPAEGNIFWKQMICNFMERKKMTTLNKNISYALQWMKGQMVCYSVLNPNAKGDAFRVRFTFDSKKYQNCKLSFNKLNQNVIEFAVNKKEKYNFGILCKNVMSKGVSYGGQTIESFQILGNQTAWN